MRRHPQPKSNSNKMLIIEDTAGRPIRGNSLSTVIGTVIVWPCLLRRSGWLVGFVGTSLGWGWGEGGWAAGEAGRRMSHSDCEEQRTYLERVVGRRAQKGRRWPEEVPEMSEEDLDRILQATGSA